VGGGVAAVAAVDAAGVEVDDATHDPGVFGCGARCLVFPCLVADGDEAVRAACGSRHR
jgi:hypothetical protein